MEQFSKELINGNTSLVGVIGYPVNHSLSPTIHNAALKALNLNWCYLAIPSTKENLEIVIKGLRAMDCKGLNITIPHKTEAINLCNEISPIAKKIGSINTLIPNNFNSWNGTNTDIEGFLAPLILYNYPKNTKTLIIGCGGSARAVVHGLYRLKVSNITIVGRKEKSLNDFINTINIPNDSSINILPLTQTDPSIKEHIKHANLIVNTTPVGMYSNTDKNNSIQVPLGQEIWDNLQSGTILYDLIYKPKPTEWLKLGEKYSCKTIDGLEMLIQQGAASLRLWSGIEDMPINIMRNAAKTALIN